MTAVLSSGSTMSERKADRGAWSMEFSTDLPTSKQIVGARPEGTGSRARKIELGRWVATIAWIKPRRLARDEAKTLPMVDTNLGCVLVDATLIDLAILTTWLT
jgi:hypothetical protein